MFLRSSLTKAQNSHLLTTEATFTLLLFCLTFVFFIIQAGMDSIQASVSVYVRSEQTTSGQSDRSEQTDTAPCEICCVVMRVWIGVEHGGVALVSFNGSFYSYFTPLQLLWLYLWREPDLLTVMSLPFVLWKLFCFCLSCFVFVWAVLFYSNYWIIWEDNLGHHSLSLHKKS